ncbi:MAG TPA: DUF1615 domain-containing protein [Steroidobacteraceae bacterium]|nr:DUF1615 domain-containing protein [Steroidobacteraceae bacterium]
MHRSSPYTLRARELLRGACVALAAPFGALLLSACLSQPSQAPENPEDVRARIEAHLPAEVHDRSGWARDIQSSFEALRLEPDTQRICAVVAVIAQESNFAVDPVIPHLGTLASQEIDTRAGADHVPLLLVHAALELRSTDGRSYIERIRAAHTERDLSDVFEDFIGRVPLGQRLFSGLNPIRTRGPMQVNVAFAERFAASHPYPYPVRKSLGDELFTRRGSVYFGVAHLLAYRAPYDRYLFRFADYNAGQYASRNAAFQRALALLTSAPVAPDGALLPRDGSTGATEQALRGIQDELRLSEVQIYEALQSANSESFESTSLYQRVFTLAQRRSGSALPRAILPQITLHSPKISRRLTTEWYARRVNERYAQCLRH